MIEAAVSVSLLSVLTARWSPRWAEREFVYLVSLRRTRFAAGVVAAVLGTAAGVWFGAPMLSLGAAAVAWYAVVAVSTDLACMRIPREPAKVVFGLTLVSAIGASGPGWLSAAVAVSGLGLITLTLILITKGGLGSGDVRFLLAAAPLAAWFGFTAIFVGLFLASLIQLPLRLVLRRTGRYEGKALPFVLAISVGLLGAVVFLGAPGAPCAEWYPILACR